MNRKKINQAWDLVWLYTGYQVLTKGLLSLLVFPLASWLINWLLASTGRSTLSSGDYLDFILSFQGLGLLLVSMGLLALLVAVDINAFILMSALVQEGRVQVRVRQLLVLALRSLGRFFQPSGFFIMAYVALIIPLVGVGISISPMKDFQIPNFITQVIFQDPLYRWLYGGLLFFLTLVSLAYIFTFHYILLDQLPLGQALQEAAGLMRRHWKSFLKDSLFFLGAYLLALVSLLGLLGLAFLVLDPLVRVSPRAWLIFQVLSYGQALWLWALLWVPIFCYQLTRLFYGYRAGEGRPVHVAWDLALGPTSPSSRPGRHHWPLVGGLLLSILLANLVLASFLDEFFDQVFLHQQAIEIVAHRGGGDLAAENSLAGLEAAIAQGASWSEIDVQRTKDGFYLVHHDPSLARLTGDPRRVPDLTLAEAQELELKDLFDPSRPSQRLALIEDFLAAAQGRIGLFIELKGASADPKMVDDLAALVQTQGLEDQVVLLSLDYQLIQYLEERYPDLASGFLYFFSLGASADLQGDYLILEENQATEGRIREIHQAGKKAYVWTVNSPESMDQFVKSSIDGIITDHVREVQEAMDRRDQRTDLEVIRDALLGF